MGNVVVGQSGGPSAVINSSLAGVFVKAKAKGAEKVYGMRNGIQGLLDEHLVLLDEILDSEEKVELLKKTPASFLGSCRYKLPDPQKEPEVYEKIFAILNAYEIKTFVYIGGNDSMDTIRRLTDYAAEISSDICFIGAPKTIDNDLAETDHTPGFGSAAKFIATVTKEVILDANVYTGKKSVYIIEIMGRNAGWLTGAAALCRDGSCPGPDMVYLPEVSFNLDDFTQRVINLLKEKDVVVVAVSEGIHLDDGTFVCELSNGVVSKDVFGHKQMGGTAVFLAEYCQSKFGAKVRAIELSTMQRCAAHISSLTDVNEAFASGAAAVEAGMDGKTGLMATLIRESSQPYSCRIGLSDIHYISNVERCVPYEWIINDGTYVSDEFIRYCRPLIIGENPSVFEGGLPKHLSLD